MAVDPGSGDGLKVSLFESGVSSKPGVTLPSRRSDHTDLGRQSPRTGASGAASIHGGGRYSPQSSVESGTHGFLRSNRRVDCSASKR